MRLFFGAVFRFGFPGGLDSSYILPEKKKDRRTGPIGVITFGI